MPALPNEQPSRRAGLRSMTVTRWPRSARWCALHRPMTPPPMTQTRLSAMARRPNAPAVRVGFVEAKGRLGGNERPAGDAWNDLAARALVAAPSAGERASD